jgi:hypothetical protein
MEDNPMEENQGEGSGHGRNPKEENQVEDNPLTDLKDNPMEGS